MVVKILCNFRFLFYLGYSTLFDIEIKLNKTPFPGNCELDFKTAKKKKNIGKSYNTSVFDLCFTFYLYLQI
jgi:hypothetical protein